MDFPSDPRLLDGAVVLALSNLPPGSPGTGLDLTGAFIVRLHDRPWGDAERFFHFPVPDEFRLLGRTLYAQGFVFARGQGATPTDVLELTLGL